MKPPHPLVAQDHHHSMAQDWPDDGDVRASDLGYGVGVFHGALLVMFILAVLALILAVVAPL